MLIILVVSCAQVLADPSFYLTDTYKPKVWGTTAAATRDQAVSAPSSLMSLPSQDFGAGGSSTLTPIGSETQTHTDTLLATLLDTTAAEKRMKTTGARAKRDRIVESKMMESQAKQRFPKGVIAFWDKHAKTALAADALSKAQAKKLAATLTASGDINNDPNAPKINIRRPGAADFHRAAARQDWLKEPWLLLDVPPQSVSSMDAVHNVMGSVYSTGVTREGVDHLVDQYAAR